MLNQSDVAQVAPQPLSEPACWTRDLTAQSGCGAGGAEAAGGGRALLQSVTRTDEISCLDTSCTESGGAPIAGMPISPLNGDFNNCIVVNDQAFCPRTQTPVQVQTPVHKFCPRCFCLQAATLCRHLTFCAHAHTQVRFWPALQLPASGSIAT